MAAFCALSGRSDLVARLRRAIPHRGEWKSEVPIVYCEEYNIRAFGLEKFHPLDSCKFQKIVALLESRGFCSRADLPSPIAVSDDILREVHTDEFIQKLQNSKVYICQIVELPAAFFVPHSLLQRCILAPCRFHVGGTILAMALAIERGWAVNLGGGAHHSRRDHGEGWCFYSDIMIGIRKIRSATNHQVQRILYIDCDVHQGNGVERDKLYFEDEDLFVLDVYNKDIFPHDEEAKEAINLAVELRSQTKDDEYLTKLKRALEKSGKNFKPDLVVYNAGTDILEGDQLGLLRVTPEAVLKRDEMVFQHALDSRAPIVMMLSGGYTKHTHKVIADSILHLSNTFHLLNHAPSP